METPEQPDWRRLLTARERERMLDDIARVSLVVGADIFPGRPWQDMGVSPDAPDVLRSPIERLAWMEHLLTSLTPALAQISRAPLADAAKETRPVSPPARARRVGTQALLQAVRRGHAARWLPETVPVLSPDTPDNRAVKAFLEMLRRDCLAVERLAAVEEEADVETRAARCAAVLGGLLAGWWGAVTEEPTAWTRPPSARAAARPEYARVFRAMRHTRRGFGFDWTHPLMTLPPRETWRLYEAWCLFQTLDALRALGWQTMPGAAGDLFAVRQGRLTLALATGGPSRLLLHGPRGRRLALAYNETFGEGQRSLSHTMQPDITLALGDRLWVLDAKFKPYLLPGEEGDDINQMHAYRDAITAAGDSAGSRNVARAWLLYAGRAEGGNRARITYGMATDPVVGALCLRPGDDASFTRLTTLLGQWIGEETETAARPAPPET